MISEGKREEYEGEEQDTLEDLHESSYVFQRFVKGYEGVAASHGVYPWGHIKADLFQKIAELQKKTGKADEAQKVLETAFDSLFDLLENPPEG